MNKGIKAANNNIPLSAEFKAQFQKCYRNNEENGCWEWMEARLNGYGSIRIGGKVRLAHRISWMIANGPIENGKQINHRCDNKICVNPSHLYMGTHADNMEDAYQRGQLTKSPNTKYRLTESDVLRIRAGEFEGMTLKQIASLFGVTDMCIHLAKTGQRWKRLNDQG